jgi:SAM-dependent methyltransferase
MLLATRRENWTFLPYLGYLVQMNGDLGDSEWQRRYEQNDTPWEKGSPAPALVKFVREGQISRRILVPGCGRGHEARALGAQTDTAVVGLDLSPTAIGQAKELSRTISNFNLAFVVGDFFSLPAKLKHSFDWLVEHTCFCAIEPGQRPAYALAAMSALRTGGKIFGIFYINPDTEIGPPFPVSAQELFQLFDPYFTVLEEWVPRESFPGRENRELIRIMQKR